MGLEFWQGAVPERYSKPLARRKTQINAYELIAVVVAAHTWADKLAGHKVFFCIDNTVALAVLCKGRSPKRDLNAWARHATRIFRDYGIEAHFLWVPSKLNLADLPSRGAPVPGALRVSAVFPSAQGRLPPASASAAGACPL